jgi:hypothetical protein
MTNDSSPAGLPLLSAGMHLDSEDGACLMEFTSVLAGERFSDAPRCTDPTLAALARLVNDATTDEGRHRLAPLAPGLAVAGRADAVGAASLVLETLLQVRTATGRPLTARVRAARRWLRLVGKQGPAGRAARWLDPLHRRGPGLRALEVAVHATAHLPAAERDDLLREVLESALADRTSRTGPRASRADDGVAAAAPGLT